MRLTSPRWADAISKVVTGGQEAATVEWIRALKKHDLRRRDVINPELCKETIQLLRPSLPQPGTCDIIDISPGAGIWSRSLHEVLKPRRHILVETEYENYKDALEPLLQEEGSRYRIAQHVNHALDEKRDFLSPELRESYASLTAKEQVELTRVPTTQLIVTANLAHSAVRSNGFSGKLSKIFFQHFYRNTSQNSGAFHWHKYGLVKLLAWVPEMKHGTFHPHSTAFAFRANKQLEAACTLREIVAPRPDESKKAPHVPWYGAALQSAKEVAAIQSQDGIRVPEYRRQPPPTPQTIYLAPIEENFPIYQSISQRPPLVDQWIAAYRSLQVTDPEWVKRYVYEPESTWLLTRSLGKNEADPRWIFKELHKRMKTTHNRYKKVDDVALDQIELERQLVTYRREHPTAIKGYQRLLSRLTPEFDALKKLRESFFKDNRSAVAKAIDDYRVLLQEPHTLSWNRRTFEPLLCHPKKDFFPHFPMTLLEVTPKPDFINTVNTSNRQITFDYVYNLLGFGTSGSVRSTLIKLVGGTEAYEKFVGTFGEPGGIQSLHDPLHGGYHNLEDLRFRTLSNKQFIDIALAYEEWPWRAPLDVMFEKLSSSFEERQGR